MKLLKIIKRMTLLKGKADLGRGPVLSTLIKLSIPSIAMVLFHTLFHLVDTVFISWLGESHMVAISYTFPVQIGVFAILEGVGNGMTALCGRRLGEGNLEEARSTALAGMGFAYMLCLIWIPFLFPYTSNMFFRTLGASDAEILRQAWLYNMWIPPTFILISFSYVVNSVF
ncbi:MAG: MATE family efflux transporter, partial [Synergistaceae bacterium]